MDEKTGAFWEAKSCVQLVIAEVGSPIKSQAKDVFLANTTFLIIHLSIIH